jgi:hypothetical protein
MLLGLDLAPVLSHLAHAIATVPVISDELLDGVDTSETFRRLTNIEDIDAGEQVLATILLNDPIGRVLVSGDKRFLRTIARVLPAEWLAVRDAVISFEMCLLAIDEKYGFDLIMERVYPVRVCDGTLRHAFGSNPDRNSFRAALISYDPCRIPDEEHALV